MSEPHIPEQGVDAITADPYEPTGKLDPLTNRTPLPVVKRFNKKTVGVLAAVAIGAAMLAFSHAFQNRMAAGRKATAAQVTQPGASTTPAVFNDMPGSYADPRSHPSEETPQLGPPLPGEAGAFAPNIVARSGYVQPASLMSADQQDAINRALRARDGGFDFGSGSPVAAVQNASDSVGSYAGGRYSSAADQGAGGMSVGTPTSGRDDANRQDDKATYLGQDRAHQSWDLKQPVVMPRSPYTVFAGTVLPGVMITGINSDLPGQIEGQLAQNVYDSVTGRYLLLPQGTKILGTYDSRVTYGQSRVLVVWTRLIRPDGSSIDLEGMPGVDLSGYAGLTGKVDRHLLRLLGAVVLGSIIQAGADAGTSYANPSYTDLARQGFGQGVNDATQQITRKELNIQPTIIVAPGARFNVFSTKDIILPPWHES
jgi:type IV secretion system protein VirB10